MTTFIRLLDVEEKAQALMRAVEQQRDNEPNAIVYTVPLESFSQVPGSPFAYWISERIRRLFKSLPLFENEGRTVRIGMKTGDDARFLRASWEVQVVNDGWTPYAKGGIAQSFYVDLPLVVNWKTDGREVKAFVSRRMLEMFGSENWEFWISNSAFYSRPGLTWPLRASRFSPQVLPAGCIFSVRGYAIVAAPGELPALLALGASSPFDYLFKVMLGRFGFPEFIVGVLQKLPVPDLDSAAKRLLEDLARRAFHERRGLDTAAETSHAFTLPALLQMREMSLSKSAGAWSQHIHDTEERIENLNHQIDERCFELYGFSPQDRKATSTSVVTSTESSETLETDEGGDASEDETGPARLAAELTDWLVGVAFGRFDVRLATGERESPPEPAPFDPLPVCSPGMLTDSHSMPAKRPPDGYSISWPEDGMLVDDAGMRGVAADRDIVRYVRQVIESVWHEKATDIEHELCTLLEVRDLREYLRKPSRFFDHHFKRYSKSRRKAPIYWPLSTASGAYVVWVYYPRLTADTLYKVVAEQVGPKIGKVEDRISQLEGGETKREGREGARAGRELGELSELLAELKDMREELLRVGKLPFKPDLNDGVQITAAPLWRLFRLPRWRSELERTWEALEGEEYDWAHLAYAIWPERVKEKCKTDKSLAIAHGLESLYEEPVREDEAERPRRRGKRAGAAQARRGR